ncbi:MAG TPA: PAS domain S-box protein [Candidatus Thermoplasmatota archaeon]|nr:PAS domain S-box protein [Candidatus Thermoplasmatota archaeon]
MDLNEPYEEEMRYRSLDRISLTLLWANLALLCLLLGYGTLLRGAQWSPSPLGWRVLSTGEALGALLVGLLACTAATLTRGRLRPHYAYRVLLTACFITFSALHVLVTGGALEWHFHFFIVLGYLTIYGDWRLGWIGLALTGLHHAAFSAIDPQWVYVQGETLVTTLVHALLLGGMAVAATILCRSHRSNLVVRVKAERDLQAANERLSLVDESKTARLRESEEQFRLALENAPIGMALVAPDGRWLKVNRALCDIVGYSQQELLSKSFQDITHPEDLEADLGLVKRVLAGELRSYQLEKRYLHRDGHAIWILLSVSLVRDTTGEPRYFISQIEDISARREAEVARVHAAEQAAQVEVLQREDRFKAEFMKMAAHELRTPLTPLKMVIFMMRRHPRVQADGDLLRWTDILDRNFTRVHRLVEDILDASRIQGAGLGLNREAIDLNQVVSDAVLAVDEAAARGQLRLEVELTPDLPVLGDPDRLRQVVENLLSNAVKFTPPSGTVKVVTSRRDGHVSLKVVDSGIGISAATLKDLFKPFNQVRDRNERTQLGTGLGLYIAKSLVELHGGRLEGSSEGPGRGATFQVLLPSPPAQ